MRKIRCCPLLFLAAAALSAEETVPPPPPAPSPPEQPAGGQARPRFAESVYFSFDVINDNTPFLYFNGASPDLEFGLGGADDAFTNGLRLEGDCLRPLWIIDRLRAQLLLNSFTWRLDTYDAGWRMDFLTLLVRAEHDFAPFTVGVTLGLAGRGNFGGAAVQNAFHRLIDYYEYTMPYIDQAYWKLSPLLGASSRAGGELFRLAGFTASGGLYARGLWDTLAAGRSSLWLGGDARADADVLALYLGAGFRLSGNGGDTLLDPAFSGGLYLLTRLDIKIGDFAIGVGLILNGYGHAAPVGAEYSNFNNYHLFWSLGYGAVSKSDPLDMFMP